MPIDQVANLSPLTLTTRIQVTNQLMTKKIEVHPLRAAAPFGTTQQGPVEAARSRKVIDRNCQVKRPKTHFRFLLPPGLPAQQIPGMRN